jgi:glycine reductase
MSYAFTPIVDHAKSDRLLGERAMTIPIRIVHYINQFFAGMGGEEAAGAGVSCHDGALGPGRALQRALGSTATIVKTIVCGDNFFNERTAEALSAIEQRLKAAGAQVLVAGPAFGSGRYGLACAQVCRKATEVGLAALTAMHEQNPGALSYRTEVVIVPTGETAAGMTQALAQVAPLALKLARGEKLGPASVEGYLSQGRRMSFDRQLPGHQRALAMLLDKLHGRPFTTEVPIQMPDRVVPAKAVANVARARLGLVTTGGLVRKGNPERAVSRMATRFHRHTVAELESLSGRDWEAFHGGYFNHIVNTNPNYILPLSFLRDLEKRGMVGSIFEWIYALPGVSTSVAASRILGRDIARDLKDGGVHAALLVST